jgi:diguanylate cyclase (GGDEF)-like protein
LRCYTVRGPMGTFGRAITGKCDRSCACPKSARAIHTQDEALRDLRAGRLDLVSFASVPAGVAARLSAAIAGSVLVLLVVLTLLYARTALPPVTAFFPIFTSLTLAGEAITAYLLITQARISGQGPLAILGAGYLYNAVIILPHLLSFPGAFSPTGLLGGHPQTVIWLWAMWHAGFPLWVYAYLIAERWASPGRRSWFACARGILCLCIGAVAFAAGATLVVLTAVESLPQLVDHGNFAPGLRSGILEVVIVANFLALIGTLALRTTSVTQVWLIVALLSAFCDVSLTMFAGARFTSGWYMARCYSLSAATIVFVVFLAEVNVIYARIAALATVDGLTGIGNRRNFDEQLAMAFGDGARHHTSLAVVMFDVDEFKKFNDTCGHLAGDEALRTVARVARQAIVRSTDTIARYGGEEFAIILPRTTASAAGVVAERVRAAIEAAGIPHPASSVSRYVTVSMGVADILPGVEDEAGVLIGRADAGLYRAKTSGRNRVAVQSAGAVALEVETV